MIDGITQLVLPVDPGKTFSANSGIARPVKVTAVSQIRQDDIQDEPKRESDDASLKNLTETLKHLNTELKGEKRGLHFSVDDDSGRIVVKVIDLETDEIIRQIPSEEMLDLISHAGEADGLIINEEA